MRQVIYIQDKFQQTRLIAIPLLQILPDLTTGQVSGDKVLLLTAPRPVGAELCELSYGVSF